MCCSDGFLRLWCCITALSVMNAYVLEGNAYHDDGFPPRDDSALRNFTKWQSAGIQGRLLCNGKPIKKAMRLVAQVGPIDDGDSRDWWDGLDENEARDDGTFFRLSGWAPHCNGHSLDEPIEPYFVVFHRCNFTPNPRYLNWNGALVDMQHAYVRRFKIQMPAEYVFDGKVPKKIWDLGTFDLAPRNSSVGEAQPWFDNVSEVHGGCWWVDHSLPAVKYCKTDMHEETPKWKYEEFP